MDIYLNNLIEFYNAYSSNINVVSMFFFILTLLFLNLMNVFRNNILRILFKIPGTLFHELAHFIVGLITFAKPVNFSLIPRFENKSIILGSVSFINLNFFNCIPIALAPLLLVPVSIYLFYVFSLSFNSAFSFYSFLYGYLIFNIISSSIPSSQDIKVGLSSKVGIIFYLLLIIIGYLYVEAQIKI